jgi:hypothetical protein
VCLFLESEEFAVVAITSLVIPSAGRVCEVIVHCVLSPFKALEGLTDTAPEFFMVTASVV